MRNKEKLSDTLVVDSTLAFFLKFWPNTDYCTIRLTYTIKYKEMKHTTPNYAKPATKIRAIIHVVTRLYNSLINEK